MVEYSKHRHIKDLVSINFSGENIMLSEKAGCTAVYKTIYMFQEKAMKNTEINNGRFLGFFPLFFSILYLISIL